MPTVSELMTHRPTAIRQTASLRAALAAMMELDVRHLPVVNEDHELVGMLSDRDLRGRLPVVQREVNSLLATGEPGLDAPVSAVMSADVMSVGPDDELAVAVEIMLDHRVGAVPVVNPEGRLVGMLSYIDALRGYHRELAETAP